jgi:fatty-acyl-CoA synthase
MSYPGKFAATNPTKPAVILLPAGQTLTYAELEDRSIRLANVLRGRGLRRGDVVAVLAENHVRYLEMYWAAVRSGLYVTPLS